LVRISCFGLQEHGQRCSVGAISRFSGLKKEKKGNKSKSHWGAPLGYKNSANPFLSAVFFRPSLLPWSPGRFIFGWGPDMQKNEGSQRKCADAPSASLRSMGVAVTRAHTPPIAYQTHSNTPHRLQVATGLSSVQFHAQDRGWSLVCGNLFLVPGLQERRPCRQARACDRQLKENRRYLYMRCLIDSSKKCTFFSLLLRRRHTN
jgi:hypothetical protein